MNQDVGGSENHSRVQTCSSCVVVVVRVHLLLLHCDSCCTRSFHMFLCHGRRMQRVHSEHRSSRDCFVYLPRSNQSARAQESRQPLVLHRRRAICSSILPAAGQWVEGPRGGGVIVVWDVHATITPSPFHPPAQRQAEYSMERRVHTEPQRATRTNTLHL